MQLDFVIELLQCFERCWLVAGRQEEHPACKNFSGRYWHGYRSGARCK